MLAACDINAQNFPDLLFKEIPKNKKSLQKGE